MPPLPSVVLERQQGRRGPERRVRGVCRAAWVKSGQAEDREGHCPAGTEVLSKKTHFLAAKLGTEKLGRGEPGYRGGRLILGKTALAQMESTEHWLFPYRSSLPSPMVGGEAPGCRLGS